MYCQDSYTHTYAIFYFYLYNGNVTLAKKNSNSPFNPFNYIISDFFNSCDF